jgi:acetyltransferase-like isoleucine patch superfamily enzyme
MNFYMLLRRVMGKPTCKYGRNSRITKIASILNAQQSDDSITIGNNSIVEGELFVFAHAGKIVVGDWCYIGPGSRIWSAENITIGNRVLISHNVNIFDSVTHPLDPVLRHEQFVEIFTRGHPKKIDLQASPLVIEEDAWIGAGATIVRGVRVGARSIIGAGSVVLQDVPSDVLVAGNPARVVRDLDRKVDRVHG